MDKDFKCPYCKEPHDAFDKAEGRLHEEGEHEVECDNCEKAFIVEASNTWSWEGKCLPQDHKYVDFSEKLLACDNCWETKLKT